PNAAHLEVAVRDDGNVERRLDPVVEPRDGDDARPIAHPVARGRPLDGLVAERPEDTPLEVAHVEKEALGVLRAVGAPGGEGEAVPAREAAPRAGGRRGLLSLRARPRAGYLLVAR